MIADNKNRMGAAIYDYFCFGKALHSSMKMKFRSKSFCL